MHLLYKDRHYLYKHTYIYIYIQKKKKAGKTEHTKPETQLYMSSNHPTLFTHLNPIKIHIQYL